MNIKYTLSKKGKFPCPKCGMIALVKYFDNDNQSDVSGEFGRCDRESVCGYHYRPSTGRTVFPIDFISLVDYSDETYELLTANYTYFVPKKAVLDFFNNTCSIAEWDLKGSKILYLSNETDRFQVYDLIAYVIPKVQSIELFPSFHGSELLDKMRITKESRCAFIKFLKNHFSEAEVLITPQYKEELQDWKVKGETLNKAEYKIELKDTTEINPNYLGYRKKSTLFDAFIRENLRLQSEQESLYPF